MVEVELDYGINAGISLRKLHIDLVPVYEEQEARQQAGIRLSDWEAMEYEERVMTVALNRVRRAIHNQNVEAEIRESKRKSRTKD